MSRAVLVLPDSYSTSRHPVWPKHMFRRPTNDAAVSRRSSLVAALAPAMRCCDQPTYPIEIDRVLTAPTLLDARADDHAVGDLHEGTDIALIGAAADQ